MQDRYVADAGDYAKYSLLRALAGKTEQLSMGVLWYRFPDEGHNSDGRHISYLQNPELGLRDPEVFDGLATLVAERRRSIAAVEQYGLLPRETVFFSESVAINARMPERVQHRDSWFEQAIHTLAGRDLIFFDPDNGIEVSSVRHSDFRAGKYAFWREIEAVWATGASLVIYNHLNRTAPAAVQTARLSKAFSEKLPNIGLLVPLLFRRGSCRHLWVIGQQRHANILRPRITKFLADGWVSDTDCDATALLSGA